jgi:2-deoxy-D-gluconate 3-dehydrogenase
MGAWLCRDRGAVLVQARSHPVAHPGSVASVPASPVRPGTTSSWHPPTLTPRSGGQKACYLVPCIGTEFRPVKLDLADSEAIASAAQAVLSTHRVDILVNNAGTQERHPAIDFPLPAWDRIMDINLRAVFQLCQLFGAPMLERGQGKIVNLASLLSFQGGMTVPAYAASKGAVAQLTKALCNEWAGRGVNVNAIAPGYMNTDMNAALLADPVRLEQLSTRIPAGRWGQPQDIGDVVVFLASRAAGYVHGQVLAVDGGWMAR